MKVKAFDCVKLQHEGGARVREATKGMTLEQRLAFWREGTEELRRLKQEAAEKAE